MKSRRLRIVLVAHVFQGLLYYTSDSQNTKALFEKPDFHLPCDPSVVTDDRAVKHPRELQSQLIESREIEHDLKAKDILLEINAIPPLLF